MDVTRQRPEGPARRRYLQIVVASVLGYGLTGLLLLKALEDPATPSGWAVLAGWVVAFTVSFVLAWKSYSKLRRRITDEKNGPVDGGT